MSHEADVKWAKQTAETLLLMFHALDEPLFLACFSAAAASFCVRFPADTEALNGLRDWMLRRKQLAPNPHQEQPQ